MHPYIRCWQKNKLYQSPYSSYIILEEEMKVYLQRREPAKDSIYLHVKAEGREPKDVEVMEHLNL